MKHKAVAMFVFLSLLTVFISAGCMAEAPSELPSENVLTETLDIFSKSLENKTISAEEHLTEFAHQIEAAGADAQPEEIESIVRNHYIDNIRLSYSAYYDAKNDKTYLFPPIKSNSEITKSIYENISFDGHQTILYGPVFSKNHGVICAFVHPVYLNGECTGIVVGYNDPVEFVSNAALQCGGLNGLGSVIMDTDGIVFYSPFTTEIGLDIYDVDSDSNVGTVSEQMIKNESGITEVFKGYTPGIYTGELDKQIAWKTIHVFNKELRVGVCSCEKIPELPKDYVPDYDAMEEAVRDVYVYAYTFGKDAAIKALNDGTFYYNDFDIFAADINGTVLASQKRPFQIGLGFINYRSAYNMKIVDTWSDIVATSGGGYNYFPIAITEDPAEDEGILTAAYLMLMDSDWYIGSMIPVQSEPVPVRINAINSVQDTMQTALKMYEEDGKAAFQKYMNKEGTPLEGNNDTVVVLNYEGIVLSSSQHPNRVGSNDKSFSMPSSGVSITRLLIMKAENGGGFVTVDINMGEDDENHTALCYVEPLNEDCFIYVMRVVGTIPKNSKDIS